MDPVIVLHEHRETACPSALADVDTGADALWLDAATVEQATGWQWKAQGLCQGDAICVPLSRTDGTLVRGDRLNLAAAWRASGQPVVHDATFRTWVLGTGAAERRSVLHTLQAPDFELPDLHGQPHRLSDWRGRRVFLATWASW